MASDSGERKVTRRRFIQGAAAAGTALGTFHILGAAPTDKKVFKVGLIGCGGRGGGAIGDHLRASQALEKALNLGIECRPWAFADWSEGKAQGLGKRHGVPGERCFGGADGYRKLIDSGVDIVLMATPPVFRPLHFEACVEAGKHVFFEKPVAVDPVGCRRVIAAGEKAKEKGLCVVAGTQRRHDLGYLRRAAAVMEGAHGRVMGGRVAWCMGKIFSNSPINAKGPGDLAGGGKWQLWVEMSGDHICEQHVHNLDIANWFLNAHPDAAVGFGGRARRVAGNMYDFFSVDLEYPGRIHIHSTCRQIGGCFNWVGEHFTFEKDPPRDYKPTLDRPEEIPFEGGAYVQEHTDLLYYLLKGKPLNEAKDVAWATAAAVMGRESAFSGKRVTWKSMMEDPKGEFYNLQLKPTAEDFEKEDVPLLKDGDVRIAGEA
ncbi:MAG TPA: Gfo/Idh/MocA family oxidoreductase [Phycisphaerae bacterium]|nr:Gfo/Idh/MocA family oxidoreductase [Phycisphaerae bacterium]